jgi:metal-responsive CopG/Arc/MetJ family transcriptional regulator
MNKVRVQIDMTPDEVDDLDAATTNTQCASRAEAVRRAAKLFKWLSDKNIDYGDVAVTYTDERGREVRFDLTMLLR